MTYGLMSELDYATMDEILSLVNDAFPEGTLNTLEVGVHRGATSRGIREFFISKKRILFHTGIDNQHDLKMSAPFPECNFIIGNSIEVYNQIKNKSQHFIFLDGCHSYPMTMADFLVYSDKVVVGGFLAFHDTGTHIKKFTDYQGMGSKDDEDMYISCRKAVEKLGLMHGLVFGWHVVLDVADPTFPTGGITLFQRHA